MTIDYRQARSRMVEEQLKGRGIRSERVIAAFREVPRDAFIDPGLVGQAYADRALPIGHGQTISQPYMVAVMTENLRPRPLARVLEIGTGSGYQGAILSHLVQTVYTIERIEPLARRAQEVFSRLGLANIVQRVGDGSLGWRQNGPYDGIVVTAAAPKVPSSLPDQLADGGRLVVPTGTRGGQILTIVTRMDNKFIQHQAVPCVFVPLVGEEGWSSD